MLVTTNTGLGAINDSGEVVLLKGSRDLISKGTAGAVVSVVDLSGGYSLLGNVDINNSGLFAFHAELDAGGEGIFLGSNPLTDKVIQTGDPLFGSTVTSVAFGALNNFNAIAFHYELANGVTGVATAIVPEPTTPGLLALLLGPLAARRRSWIRS